MKILVTGGAGFIGSSVIRHLIGTTDAEVVNVDALTYAATPEALDGAQNDPRYTFEKVDIRDADAVSAVFDKHKPDRVMHLAAESHVDRSIDGPSAFLETNIFGTFNMLQAARAHWENLSGSAQAEFRFHHVSTDEVYGSLGMEEPAFTETTPYAPNSPYSASKASSDHLVRAWGETYGLPVVTSNCSNNYGPWQFPEKLIPVILIKARNSEPLPVYGKGENVRDWLYVDDHAKALCLVLEKGRLNETYNIGGDNEATNIDLVKKLCAHMDDRFPDQAPHEELISYVTDRPGHDMRYGIDATKIRDELGWQAEENVESGLEKTVDWYLANEDWWRGILSNKYAGERLGKKVS